MVAVCSSGLTLELTELHLLLRLDLKPEVN